MGVGKSGDKQSEGGAGAEGAPTLCRGQAGRCRTARWSVLCSPGPFTSGRSLQCCCLRLQPSLSSVSHEVLENDLLGKLESNHMVVHINMKLRLGD